MIKHSLLISISTSFVFLHLCLNLIFQDSNGQFHNSKFKVFFHPLTFINFQIKIKVKVN